MIIRLEANQKDSPLLRLPAEIRDMIWRYALEKKTFDTSYQMNRCTHKITRAKFKPARKSPRHGAALLRTCRQLFLETATYPLTLGSLSCDKPGALVAAVKKLRAYQKEQVSRICIRLITWDLLVLEELQSDWCSQMIRRSLPTAKSLELVIDFPIPFALSVTYIHRVRQDLKKVWREEDGWNVTVRITIGK
jgi:hypothetical protein